MRYYVRRATPEDHIALAKIHDPEFYRRDFHKGVWWVCWAKEGSRIEAAGMCALSLSAKLCMLERVAVVKKHRGHGLQARMMAIAERHAKRIGYDVIVSDTTDNVHSANNFVRRRWHTFKPRVPWRYKDTIYWRKRL